MQAAFSYKGAAGDSAHFIYTQVRKARARRFVDVMCGSCTVPAALWDSPNVYLALNDLNYYVYINASATFVDTHEPKVPSAAERRVGNLSNMADFGYWSKSYRGWIDACVSQYRSDTTMLAAVSRALLAASYRGAAWSDKAPNGRLISSWGSADARAHVTKALRTVLSKRRPGRATVQNKDWFQALGDFCPQEGDFVYIEPPFPWPAKDKVATDIYRWYDKINSVLFPLPWDPDPPVFDSPPGAIAIAMKAAANAGATVMLMKQTHSDPPQSEFTRMLGEPIASLPIRGQPEHPAREEFFVCRS